MSDLLLGLVPQGNWRASKGAVCVDGKCQVNPCICLHMIYTVSVADIACCVARNEISLLRSASPELFVGPDGIKRLQSVIGFFAQVCDVVGV